jgi:2-methylcitrate dehydratase PrpD
MTLAERLAALANGAFAHGLDFDDTHPVSITHASAVILPTVLALGEAAGRDGQSVVTAAVAGYETIARVGMAAPGAFHAAGWHATAVCGTFAATLAAGRLEGLDERRLTAALGIAGSFASGRIQRARHDPRRPLRPLPDLSSQGARTRTVRHAGQGMGNPPGRLQAVSLLPLQPCLSRLRAGAPSRARDRA